MYAAAGEPSNRSYTQSREATASVWTVKLHEVVTFLEVSLITHAIDRRCADCTPVWLRILVCSVRSLTVLRFARATLCLC